MISVKSLHTFGLDANVQQVIEVGSVEQLTAFIGKRLGTDFILIGEGSNTIFLEDYLGILLVMKLRGVKVKELENSHSITVQAGENWHSLVEYTLEQGIYGLENLALIPGSVGACPVQNIGAYGVEINRFIESVQYFDLSSGELVNLTNAECEFSYRDSIFKASLKDKAIITSVTFSLPKSWSPVVTYGELAELEDLNAKAIFDKVIATRLAKLPDPAKFGNAGSFFKNPIIANSQVAELKSIYPNIPVYSWCEEKSKVAAGWLIDKADLKGFEVNGTAVHVHQALVLINKSGVADSASLVELISIIQDTVFSKFKIYLEPEVRMFDATGETTFANFLGKPNG